MILCDTGPLVAAALGGDQDHRACVDMFTAARLTGDTFLIPATVVAEVGYLLNREAGPTAESLFLSSLANGDFDIADLGPTDFGRMAELVTEYADMPLGTTDASVIALAERYGIVEVATLDRRHFSVVRPKHTAALALLP